MQFRYCLRYMILQMCGLGLFWPSAMYMVSAQSVVGQLAGLGVGGPYDAVATQDGGQVLCGIFTGILDLDPGPGTTVVSCPGGLAAWVAKYDDAGELAWGFALGNSGDVSARGLVEDEHGHLHVVGYFNGVVDLDPGVGVVNVTSAGDWDIWYLELAADGSFARGGRIGGADRQYPTDIACDGDGSIWLAGILKGPADMDPGPGTFMLTGSTDNNAFIARYDLMGGVQWAYPLPGVPYMAVDGTTGNIYLTTGSQTDAMTTQDLDPGSGTLSPLSPGDPAADYMALLKLDANGDLLWARVQRGHADLNAWDNQGLALAVDALGDVYWAGTFLNDFNAYPGNDLTLDAPGTSSDGFLVKYNGNGALIWEKRFGAANAFDHCSDVLLDDQGNIWVAGSFQGLAELNSAGPSVQVLSAGGYDVFVAAFLPSGGLLWHGAVGGMGNEGTPQLTEAVNGMRLSGFFSNSADLDPTPMVSTLTAQNTDPFLVTFQPTWMTFLGREDCALQFQVFPIPCNGVLHVAGLPADALLELQDPTGRVVWEGKVHGPIDLTGHSGGIYWLRATHHDRLVAVPVMVAH